MLCIHNDKSMSRLTTFWQCTPMNYNTFALYMCVTFVVRAAWSGFCTLDQNWISVDHSPNYIFKERKITSVKKKMNEAVDHIYILLSYCHHVILPWDESNVNWWSTKAKFKNIFFKIRNKIYRYGSMLQARLEPVSPVWASEHSTTTALQLK